MKNYNKAGEKSTKLKILPTQHNCYYFLTLSLKNRINLINEKKIAWVLFYENMSILIDNLNINMDIDKYYTKWTFGRFQIRGYVLIYTCNKENTSFS